MNGRERLVAWANTAPDDFVKSAVREADRHASENIEGDDEHELFVSTWNTALDLKRSTGAPTKDRFDADLKKFRLWAGRNLSHGQIAAALEIKGATRATSLSQSTIRNRLRAIDKERASRRDEIAALLKSPISEQGITLMQIAIEHRNVAATDY